MGNNMVPKLRFKGFTDPWEQCKLEDLMTLGNGCDYKNLESGNIPVYGTGGYMTSVNKSLCNQDSIGIGRKGTINKPYLLKAPFWTVDTLFFATPKNNCDLNYLYGLFQTINWSDLDESTGVPSLSKTNINGVIVSASKSMKEQKCIGQTFSALDNLLTLHQRKFFGKVRSPF